MIALIVTAAGSGGESTFVSAVAGVAAAGIIAFFGYLGVKAQADAARAQAKVAGEKAEQADRKSFETSVRVEENGRRLNVIADSHGDYQRLATSYDEMAHKLIEVITANSTLVDRATSELTAREVRIAEQAAQIAENQDRIASLEARVAALSRVVAADHPDLVQPDPGAGHAR